MTTSLYDFQSPEETGNKEVATSLQTEEVVVSSRLRMSTNGHIVTMRGDILSPATMLPNPKPVFPTEMSTLVYPPRGGT